MYQIINVSDGSAVGNVEKPYYITLKESTGCFIPTDELHAQGISFLGSPYNLHGRKGIGVPDSVYLIEFDAGVANDSISAAIAENSAAIDDIIISLLEG